jgi:acylpyruvate hydrolase
LRTVLILPHYSRFIPKSLIPDPHDCELYLSVNDKVKQQDSTNLMLFRIPRLLSHLSSVMTIEPGDIVLTGTPKGKTTDCIHSEQA